MCTIIIKDHLVGKNYDSAAGAGMIFTNKRGQVKSSSVFPPDRTLDWVSSFGSVTFSQSGKEFPVSGINEAGLIVEQATLLSTKYPEHEDIPAASSLQTTQFLLDTCGSVEHALEAMAHFSVVKSSWPVHFALIDSGEDRAIVEFLGGEKKVFRSKTYCAVLINNEPYLEKEHQIDCRQSSEMFAFLRTLERPETIWSNVFDFSRRTISVKTPESGSDVVIELDQLDFSPSARNLMLNIKEDKDLRPYTEDANRELIGLFFHDLQNAGIMNLTEEETEAMTAHMAEQPKKYDRNNAIMVRFLKEEQISQLPTKDTHKQLVLKYLASKFEIGKEYSEGQVNAVIDEWHTFGDYFVLRRGLIDSGLLERLPNGSKYWRKST